MTIHLLAPEVASQIAAGEVIERPASVVKELVENALDAGARFISIKIEGAGQGLIEVADDGSGIPAGEIQLAVERHATSKLNKAEDLFKIGSLGFRGEALASIASVSRLTLTSRTRAAEHGAQVVVEGGIASPPEPAGAPAGTVVRVEDLFYNVPARRKFLKTDNTERRVIDTLVTRYALAYPEVRFQLRQENRVSLQTSGKGDRREVLAALYGVEVARQMLEIVAVEDELKVNGFISPIALTRSNRREMIFFINGRPVQDASLAAALLKGYHTLLMVGRYPLAALFLELPVESVDVNVHPTKAEVRFRSPDKIFTGLQAAVRRGLLAHTPIPGVGVPPRWIDSPRPMDLELEREQRWGPDWETAGSQDEEDGYPGGMPEAAAGEGTSSGIGAAGQFPQIDTPLLRLIGQIASTYLVAEGPDGLYLVDQHAAHERVLFERFMSQRQSGIPKQALLQGAVVELQPSAARLLEEQLPILADLGFQVEGFGPNAFLVRAIPAILSGADPAAAVRTLVEDFEEDETPLQAQIEERIIARVCKRAAVKAGQTLTGDEQGALLRDLERCHSPRTCPHGRPTMIHLSVDLLEKQFGRKGAR